MALRECVEVRNSNGTWREKLDSTSISGRLITMIDTDEPPHRVFQHNFNGQISDYWVLKEDEPSPLESMISKRSSS